MQPRLGNARKLVDGGLVRRLPDDDRAVATFEVQGTGTLHRVRICEDHQSCTCPWFSKYQGQRGPCKHILAASIVAEDAEAVAG
nr:SWIM zinc finger family protein [Sphingomonas leidyi]